MDQIIEMLYKIQNMGYVTNSFNEGCHEDEMCKIFKECGFIECNWEEYPPYRPSRIKTYFTNEFKQGNYEVFNEFFPIEDNKWYFIKHPLSEFKTPDLFIFNSDFIGFPIECKSHKKLNFHKMFGNSQPKKDFIYVISTQEKNLGTFSVLGSQFIKNQEALDEYIQEMKIFRKEMEIKSRKIAIEKELPFYLGWRDQVSSVYTNDLKDHILSNINKNNKEVLEYFKIKLN